MDLFGEKDGRSVTLHCFSPLATTITFIIELTFAAYTLLLYRRSRVGQVSVLMLAFLGSFQLAESVICGGSNYRGWTQFAFFSITLLPPLGLHLVTLVTRKNASLYASYALAAVAEGFILFRPSIFERTFCAGRFVAFDASAAFEYVYAVYYLGFLAIGVGLLIRALWKRYGDREMTAWLLAAYASFIAPTLFLYAFFTTTRAGFSSIMCGFAIIFAFVLALKILPLEARRLKLARKG